MKPSRVVVDVSSTVRQPAISTARVKRLVESTLREMKIRDALVSVAFVGRTAIARLNRSYLKHDGPTDVISFGMTRDARGAPVIGDIYICPEIARHNAAAAGIPASAELARLVVHGTLHVAGLDHPVDESRVTSPMWKKQERILARGN
ncbi:MAG TPA: rRNA maturation RNase YbeY [Gemmatimonadaceae bacterium]|nr:rRNA maturation RNase YbeY [Gemmatimonadaceae bacterium]